MSCKNLLILGATGNIGQWLVELALERGHQVTALARSKAKLEDRAGLTIVEGDPMNAADLERVMPGHDAVLTALGIRRETQANPWSPVLSPVNLTEVCAINAVNAMQSCGVQRIIAVSAAGVGASKAVSAPEIMNIVATSNVAVSFRDLDKMERVLAQSGLDTLAVRPVTLIGDEASGEARILEFYQATSVVSKRDVAAWMLDAVERPQPFESKDEMIGYS
ncbi:NAD(P)H-binding protein [Tropicibacter sp. R16_0]|uniref:NAD(P)H-binding protein n=1 Tax=Tropicibacter sp. R16_0 TaxID=2821102 RepID=UPI001ADD5B64|nr:NAD(P)H-binding protein [Tropicibacter sp. R16_0]MBO9453049.1 NAD(P)H-binding protein [Tropicibacter sp. R16_0]